MLRALNFLTFSCYLGSLSGEESQIPSEIPLIPVGSRSFGQKQGIPVLGFGTAGLGAANFEVVSAAIERGITLIDTAQAKEWYNEEQVAKAVQFNIRNNPSLNTPGPGMFVVTKVHPRSFAPDKMEEVIKTSLRRLTDGSTDPGPPLDAVLLHSPWCWQGHCSKEEERVSWKTGWKSLEDQQRRGRIAHIGVSNFDAPLLLELLAVADSRVAIVQNWMDPFHQDRETRELCKSHGIVYMAYSSLGTQWGGKLGTNPVLTSRVLQGIARKYERSVAQVVVSWVLQLGAVAIPRSSNIAHIEELKLFKANGDGFVTVFLDEEDMRAINALDGTLGDPW